MDSEGNRSSARISPIWRLLPRASLALALAALCLFVGSSHVPAPPRYGQTEVLAGLKAPISTLAPTPPQSVPLSPTPRPAATQPVAPSPTLAPVTPQPVALSPTLAPAAPQPAVPSPPLEPAAPEPVPPSPAPVPDIGELVSLINGYRAENGLQPLVTSPALTQAAQWMSEDMAGNGYLSHTDSLGRGNLGRLAAFGYDCTAYNTWCGENLAAGTATGWETLDAWRKSPAHNDLLLKADFAALGIGCAYNQGSAYGWYWVIELGGEAR